MRMRSYDGEFFDLCKDAKYGICIVLHMGRTPGVGLVGCLAELLMFGSFGPRHRHMEKTLTRIPAFHFVHHKTR